MCSWKQIGIHSNKISEKSLNEIFIDDKDRFNKFSIQENDLLLDFSKNHIDDNKTNTELVIIYNLMRYANLKDHKRMTYATLLYTDFLLYLREEKILRKTILKL